ncbi:GNAT family N-acetyltransferase [Paenarthrobacter aurescens]|uniref:Ribosomal protein S5 alanine N-acetyltransferase n=1 Tax=Paenarthrobacter aurescens TaxID=43663 RepID=A0A4Y3NEH2_PAEAU|nr:GNAT family N-acetyltransferase [Paenarthrobacter aurescens]MDO6145170.1 GNAT family N-acetyltransferase [Paenarthrobacter aurescens]MDO6149015.1 GNAT family N-acetyltransferase [Paenarthrobacter aurescens]MDO6160261.1 GNAT family N-acetyltransferase [Paenarthrobacter aurescens]MDO6164120.1 GNAT family N-acetyltransferase [Paenarthrobacter aurescens]GEB20250.1 ribosomal protein S5 alanine N-acetyltransferase [Paenarthrobacter aurescens]
MSLMRNLDNSSLGVSPGEDDRQCLLRPVELSDASAVAAAYRRNRQHLAPWEPARPEEFFTAAGQEAVIQAKLKQYQLGTEVPWVVTTPRGIAGMVTLSGIVRGPFLSANLGYWIDQACTGNGLAAGAVAAVVSMATKELNLHRIQAATLPHNAASQAVLRKSAFQQIGVAPSYLQIAGEWQDHVLFQRILF